jgi:subtilisin family serine protease
MNFCTTQLGRALFTSGLLFAFYSSASADVKKYLDGEVLVKYKKDVSQSGQSRTLDQIYGLKIRAVGGDSTLVRVKVLSNQSVEQTLLQLQSDPNVEYAQPNFIYHATALPNDPSFAQQWGMNNTGQIVTATSNGAGLSDQTDNPGTAADDMSLPAAWDYITDCSSVVVAVLDTGIAYNHEDLSANMWDGSSYGISLHGINLQDGTNDPMDNNGHGSHVAGVIGAVGNNGVGVSGICWKASLMAVKVLDSTGTGSTSTIADGISWAVAHGARVVNLSLGTTSEDPAINAAVAATQAQGAVIVAAAGNNATNNNNTPFYPCNSPSANVICVAAVDQQFNLASFSNYGSTSVHVAAPGVNIVSTYPYASTKTTDDFSTWTFNSTTGGAGWGATTTTLYGPSEPLLGDPHNWNGSSTYKPNTDDHAYRTYNLTGSYDQMSVQFYEGYNMANSDVVNTYISSTGGDPVTSGVLQESDTGSFGFTAYSKTFNLLSFCPNQAPTVCSCATSSCSIGFELHSFSSSVSTGGFVLRFNIIQSTLATDGYNLLEGTSMATPHVAGLAAMLMAFQPAYTYADVIDSLMNGGTVVPGLAGKTISGTVVNAMGSLQSVRAPQNVRVQKL